MSTTLLKMMLYTVHFSAAVPLITKLKSNRVLARHMTNVAPMLAILSIGARMHALQVDSKHDSPQRWVQVCFYDCIASVCVQTPLVILMPVCPECECKEGPSESDVVLVMENRTLAAVVTAIRYLAFLGPYGDVTAVSFKIGEAAKKLSNASDPFLKNIDWLFDLHIKPLPGASFAQFLKAVDQTIVMGNAMDGNLLKATAEAHHKAIGSIDAKGVTSAADYEAVNAALDHAVAFVPTSKVMDVCSAWAGILNEAVPNKLVSTVNPIGRAGRSEGLLRVQGRGRDRAAEGHAGLGHWLHVVTPETP
jgi:hypothetical protein